MFTGIVEELGSVVSIARPRLRVGCSTVLEDVELGASVAVNGCCLTVVAWGENWFEAELSDETFSRTQFGRVAAGDPVNLERPARLADRLGGHLVQGHVDAVGEIVAEPPDLWIRVPSKIARYLVEKGSVCVDGVSLTVTKPDGDQFGVAVIPHTAEVTTLGRKSKGDAVNIEVDVLAKYTEKLLAAYEEDSGSS